MSMAIKSLQLTKLYVSQSKGDYPAIDVIDHPVVKVGQCYSLVGFDVGKQGIA